jgi:hypothetical protein
LASLHARVGPKHWLSRQITFVESNRFTILAILIIFGHVSRQVKRR